MKPIAASNGVSHRPVDTTMVLWLLLLTCLWGLNAISIKVLVGGMAPIMGAAMRGLVALVLLAGYGLLRGETLRVSGRVGMHGLLNGALFGLEFILIYHGASFTNGGHISLFINVAPFFVAIGAHYLLPNDRLTALKVAGLLLAFLGVMALFYDDLFVAKTGYWRGDLLVIAGAFCWGCSTVYVKRVVAPHYNAFRLLYTQVLGSTPMIFLATWLLEDDYFHNTGWITWANVFYQGVVVVFISYMIWLALLRRYPASAMQSFTFMSPVWGVVMGVWLLDEQVTLVMALGIALVGLGLFLVNRPVRNAGESP